MTRIQLKVSVLAVCWLTSLLGSSAVTQEIAIQEPPYYVGEPVVVQVVASGLDGSAQPVCRFAGTADSGLQVLGPQVSTSSFSQVNLIDMTRKESVDYKFTFQVTASSAGRFTIGPFELDSGGSVQTVEAFPVEFEQLENDADVQVELTLPNQSIYVGQEVPVTIRWGFSGDIRATNHAFNALQIRSPLFDQFEFKDEPPRTRQTLTLATAQGAVHVDGEVTKTKRADKEFIVVTGQRTMIAQSPGEYSNIPITCRTQKVTQWRRSVFGDLSAARAVPAVASGTPISFTVKPIPREGRPASFSGAVGKGFSLEVAANRSVVRVGDPISLDIQLRGDGNLEKLSLPNLAAADGLDASQFQLPEEPPSGSFVDGVKQFKVSVRVKEEQVRQIPGIAFSWFDPEREQFETTRSKPIALQVMPAQIVSSSEVFSGASIAKPPSQTGQVADQQSGSPALSFVGANLAIQKDVSVLVGASHSILARPWLVTSIYGLGFALIVAAWIAQRRSEHDPIQLQRKQLRQRVQQRIRAAGKLNSVQAAETLAAALRELLPVCDAGKREAVDVLIAQCDSIAYARIPVEQGGQIAELVLRAIAIVDEVLVK